MAIHVGRNNMKYGTGEPTIAPEYYGQTYIDTATNPRTIYIATSENSATGWKSINQYGHKHTVEDISDLKTEITKIVQNEGISAAIQSLLGGNNTWDGDWNNFTGDLRNNGRKVLSGNSSIGELIDVKLEENMAVNTLLGWNGSYFVPYEVTGASPSDGGIDFSQYIRKDNLAIDTGSNADDIAISVGAVTKLKTFVSSTYAEKNHVHPEYALIDHEHPNYLDRTKPGEIENSLTIGSNSILKPLSLIGKNGNISFSFPETEQGSTIVAFSAPGGNEVSSVILGGTDGNTSGSLTLNFSNLHIPTGGFTIGENKKYMTMPPMKLNTKNLTYVGSMTRKPALDLNNGAVIGLNQLVFATPSRGKDNSLLFPKNYAGNGQPTEAGYYHYLRLADGELKTDTALASESKYISLGGIRIFFQSSDPGNAAREGDVWFKI